LADIQAIERVPLDERLSVVDFHQRIQLALKARDPEDTAIYFVPDGEVDGPVDETSFALLRKKIELTAGLLQSHGVGRADVVAILLPTLPATYWSIIGTMSRAIPFPINWMLEPKHLLGLLIEADVKAVIALGPTPGFKIWDAVASIKDQLPAGLPIWSVAAPGSEILPDSDFEIALARQAETSAPAAILPADGQDVAAYIHSGGTTGLPKIVKLSHRNISYRHWTVQLAQQVTVGEVIPQDTPIFHVGGLAGRCLPMLACGVSLVIPSIMGARDKRYIANYWKFVDRFGLTRLSGVPTMFSVLAKSPPQGDDLSSLRRNFISGSTALPAAVRNAFERVSGVRILNSYGLTENTATVAIELRDGPSTEGSSGTPVPYTRVRVAMVDAPEATPRLCGENETGMLQVNGPGLALGYLSEEHTRTSRTPDGWLITGDLGRIDHEGNLFVTGRAKDVIIRGGHNIDPGLIEEALLQSSEVLFAAAVAKPDAYAGELPVAYVQLVPGSRATEAELIEFAAKQIAERAAIPKEIFIVDKLPLTAVGKPIKVDLRQDAAERHFRSALSQIPGLSGGKAKLDVAVRPHPLHGSQVTIQLKGLEPADEAAAKREIEAVMEQYAFAYQLEG
jgi:fatty-acyl-CoA synthase